MTKYILNKEISPEIKEELKEYGVLTQTLLVNRGIKTKDEAFKFLNPSYEKDIYDPFLILGMKKAVKRILQAIDKKEKIVIYGDYDSDGIPGSVVLHDFFKKIGYENFENYIPHRDKEGYGLNIEAVDKFAEEGAKLLITVDCGITDIDEVDRANDLGIDVIITDHHLPQENIPKAYVILNSKQEEDKYPDDMLCGAGVAFKLIQALIKEKDFELEEGWEKWLLDMVGISTIADMVPLRNENRALAYFGLKVLRKSRRPGIKTLLRKIKVNQQHLSETDISFMISPRINAASRMDVPFEAFRLLSTKDESLAEELSNHLNKINDQRKGVVASMVKEAKKKLEVRSFGTVIVIGNPEWKPGVLGLAANSLSEEYQRPAFVWGREGSIQIKGSCRSDGSVNLVELMTSVKEEIFINVGGHAEAGGFSITHEKIHLLEENLIEAYQRVKKDKKTDNLCVDAKMSLNDVNWNSCNEVEKLAPFGMANPQPTFLFENIEISDVQKFGKTKNHLRLNFKDSNNRLVSSIGFFIGDKDFGFNLEPGKKINLVANLEKSVFRGFPELRLRIVDIQEA